MQSIVTIDIETTGLNEERDAIIEIGAVRFKGRRVADKGTKRRRDRREARGIAHLCIADAGEPGNKLGNVSVGIDER